MSESAVETFDPTGGRITAALALPVAGVFVLVAAFDGEGGLGRGVGAFAALLGVVAWASMLRPRVLLVGEDLVLRNMLETVSIPLAAVEELVVRQVLAVRAGDRRYISPAVGRSWRKLVRPDASGVPGRPVTEIPYADFVEDRIRARVDEARRVAGVRPGSPEQLALATGVRREPAWLPIGLIAAAALVLLALLVL